MQDQATKLRELVTKERTATGPAQTRTRRIVISGAKGGVGVSTIALNLAVSAQYQGHRVLLIDADPVCGDLATICDLTSDFGLEDVLQSRRDWNSAMVVGPAGISLVPRVGDFTAELPTGFPQSQQLLRKIDTGIDAFDLILIDAGSCAANLANWGYCDETVLVMTPNHISLNNAYRLMKKCSSAQCALPRVLMNQVDKPEVAADAIARLKLSCKQFLGTALETLPAIEEHDLLRWTLAKSRPVACVDPNASVARTLARIAVQLSELTTLNTD